MTGALWGFTYALSTHAVAHLGEDALRRHAEGAMRHNAKAQGVTLGEIRRVDRVEMVILPDRPHADDPLDEWGIDMPVEVAEAMGIDLTGASRYIRERYEARTVDQT